MWRIQLPDQGALERTAKETGGVLWERAPMRETGGDKLEIRDPVSHVYRIQSRVRASWPGESWTLPVPKRERGICYIHCRIYYTDTYI